MQSAHYDLGVLLHNQGKFDAAEAAFREAAEIDVRNAMPLNPQAV